MAVSTRIGGNKPKKLPGMLIMMVTKPKGAGGPNPDLDEPDADDMPGAPPSANDNDADDQKGGGAPAPGTAGFHDQRQLCSNCNYFDPQGMDGVGECKLGVPEADFTISDPDASNCDLWAAQDKRSADSAARTGASVTNVPPPPDTTPPAA